jgi:hypothetical protein
VGVIPIKRRLDLMISLVVISLIISIAALIVALLALSKAGGIPELKKQTESLREKVTDIREKVEGALKIRREKEAEKTKEPDQKRERKKA